MVREPTDSERQQTRPGQYLFVDDTLALQGLQCRHCVSWQRQTKITEKREREITVCVLHATAMRDARRPIVALPGTTPACQKFERRAE